ncbi:hypothetical protein PHMEG_0004677 [Phytophthora megakarya]|uniref:Uncharacterized protein n=1 Tax=Phytophthora megakarya TaxID=4795 RepID=A0A225WTA7_9STRA|nr:hypothetical protein PHMEG_0004677 [Phytophthora megakarya]
MVDVCARFTTVDLTNSRTIKSGQTQAIVALPFNPPSERYNALHSIRVDDGRNFAFAVWSTGFCIMELLFSDAQGRLPCDSFNGMLLKRHGGVQECGSISVYQQVPSPQVIIFTDASLRFASLPTKADPNLAKENALPIVDYVIAADAIILLWSHGLVEKHNLSDNRVFTIAQPFEFVGATATTMINILIAGRDAVIVGDSMGCVCAFLLIKHDTLAHNLITRKQAHPQDRSSTSSSNDDEHDFVWELLTCFRVYSPHVSAAIFVAPEFLFCGFDSGSVECWQFPSRERSSSKGPRLQQQANQSISVVKRALHVIDLHMAPVLSIIGEPGAGTAVLTKSQPADNFSWVFSYDQDAIILVWCFSLDFLFPHRRIKVHGFIKGIYISPTEGSLDLYAYVGRCIDRIDHLCSGDTEAVRLRLLRGRELSAQRALKNQENNSNQATKTEWHRVRIVAGSRPSDFTPDAYDRSRFLIGAPSVRINITLPEVEQKVVPLCKSSTGTSPAKHLIEESKSATPIAAMQPELNDTQSDVNTLHSILSSSPTHMLERRPISKPRTSPALRGSPLRYSSRSNRRKIHTGSKTLERNTTHYVKSNYQPGENSIPSSFQHAKPRVYRKAVNPLDSISAQACCTVVTHGDGSASPPPTASGDEDNPEMLDTVEVSQILVRPASTITLDAWVQEKVSVVSLVEDEDESILLLEYQTGSRRSRTRRARMLTDENHEISKSSYEIPFLSWDRMSEHDRRVELMAASKSRCIQECAERDDISVPSTEDFERSELSVQLEMRSFTRWFLTTYRHHQRIREGFLMEELLFAAIDPVVHEKLADVSITPPSPNHIGVSTSTVWQDFVSWYCLGLSTRHQTIPVDVLQRERLKARTGYLEERLHKVAQSEQEVQEEEEKAGPCEEGCEPPQRVFIFEHFVKHSLSDKDNPMSWENTSLENQQKEIMLALMDPAIQIAAMRNDIELPDVSGSCMEDFDILALAGKFVPWWKASRNTHRRDFLKREVHEASTNKSILELLFEEHHTENEEIISKDGVIKYFFESYFKSDTARHTFLKKKLFYLKRKSRIASVARYGKPPAPLVLETLPLPLVTSFELVKGVIVEDVKTEQPFEVVDEEEIPDETKMAVEVDQDDVDFVDNQREQEEGLRRLEDENAKIALELICMTQEDSLAQEYNNSFVESDEDVDERSVLMPKRTDFSRSYFFGNLPVHYRKVVSSGWRSGSGVYNGDEEYEEEEQLEREHERQRLLDEQEAERLLELGRQGERARIEREREEKAFQFRRLRQAELKKVLIHQAELEAQRKTNLDMEREGLERARMQKEGEHSCWHRDQLLRDQNGMRLEDQLAFQIRKDLREATTAKMRLLLYERYSMLAEDQRSSIVGKELQELEHARSIRTVFLSELYTPVSPFYQGSGSPSEDFLPQIQCRLEQEQLRRTRVKAPRSYTIPLEEALVLDELDQEPYLARDSRRFKVLMGLPLRTSSCQKRPRIPTAGAIIAMQKQQRQLAEFKVGHHEMSTRTGKLAQFPHDVRHQGQIDERSRLPDITSKFRSISSLTDLKEACRMQDAATPTKRKSAKNSQQQQNQQQQSQQHQSLPFFRGNMFVQGHGQTLSKDFAY